MLLRVILSLYFGSSVGCEDQPYSWVGREVRERYATKCADRTVCFHLINQETQFF
jgi:hypothetical protein